MAQAPQVALDFKNAAHAVISGAISGVTPKVSGWIRVVNVDTVTFATATTSTADGIWTAEVATDYLGSNAVALASNYISPDFPTGAASSATNVLTIPDRRYTHLRLTFTPSGGAGNATATTGAIVGRPCPIERHSRSNAVAFYVPTGDTTAGQFALEYSETRYDRDKDGCPPQIDNLADPQVWYAATDASNTAISIAATTSGGYAVIKRLGAFEFESIRVKYTPTSGFGRARAIINGKG